MRIVGQRIEKEIGKMYPRQMLGRRGAPRKHETGGGDASCFGFALEIGNRKAIVIQEPQYAVFDVVQQRIRCRTVRPFFEPG